MYTIHIDIIHYPVRRQWHKSDKTQLEFTVWDGPDDQHTM